MINKTDEHQIEPGKGEIPLTTEAYTEIGAQEFETLLEDVDIISSALPSAIFIGGTGLRLWIAESEMTVPEEMGGDLDIYVPEDVYATLKVVKAGEHDLSGLLSRKQSSQIDADGVEFEHLPFEINTNNRHVDIYPASSGEIDRAEKLKTKHDTFVKVLSREDLLRQRYGLIESKIENDELDLRQLTYLGLNMQLVDDKMVDDYIAKLRINEGLKLSRTWQDMLDELLVKISHANAKGQIKDTVIH